jgi:putative ABC transport system permease protein
MFKNYLRIAFRNLWRHRVFSFLNIMGLTMGMTACFLVFLYVRFELSYDGFLLAGRAFSRAFGTDTTQAMVLNESAVKSGDAGGVYRTDDH